MRRTSLIAILLVLLVSLFLLSVLSNILTGYPEPSRSSPETDRRQATNDTEKESPTLLFTVSPATPQLYWRVTTADYYTGRNWLRTTNVTAIKDLPQVQDDNKTTVFTVEFNITNREEFLPLPPPESTLINISFAHIEELEFYRDTVGDAYKVKRHGQKEALLNYKVLWRDVEVDDRLISLDNVSEEILDKYLQLPDLPIEVWELAKDLEDSSYSILDQILADIQYLRTNFVYELEATQFLYGGITQGSDVSSYIEREKGVCIDAATALVVILREQKIPARISIGYKPGEREGDRLLYYTSGAHALAEVYLPPYGWVQFDATPPLEENPLVKVSPFKQKSSPGSRLFYRLAITNRRNVTDNFRLLVDSQQEWSVWTAPAELRIEAQQTVDALLEVSIPDEVYLGEKNRVTITTASMSNHSLVFSILAITQVQNVTHVSTTTTLENVDQDVIRGGTFWANGTVLTTSDERIDNMTIFVFLTKGGEAEGTIVGKGYSKQGNFQIESTVPYYMEIGDYKVVFISLGTTQYAPSDSDSLTRVRATTRVELGSEEEVLLGYGVIHGRLSWDNGTGFENASITLNLASLATPSEVWKLQNLTFRDGSFRIETTFNSSGTYEVDAVFSGNEYVLGSNVTHVIELERGIPEIQVFSENIAVRGEVFNITGTIQFKDTGVFGEPVTVAFDNQLLGTVETGDNGSYAWSFLVNFEETLGLHFFTVALQKESELFAVRNVVVQSSTTLTTEISDAAGGMFLLLSASLQDDHNLPVPDAEISVDNYGLAWKTDKNGNLTFLLDTVRLWSENLVVTTRFEGSDLYSSATTEKEVAIEPETSLPFLIPLVSPIWAVTVFVYFKHYSGRQQAVQQTGEMNVAEEAIVEEELAYRPQEMQPLNIVLSDIEASFPNVWGVRDKLRISIVLDKSGFEGDQKMDVEVLIDEDTFDSVRLSQQGRAGLSHTFTEKGEHKVKAILRGVRGKPPLNAELKLRIVEYQEEIVRLYNEFLEKLASHGVNVRSEMTAREIASLILGTGGFNPEALRMVTTCFEKAEYSNHLAMRGDYKMMFLSLGELNSDI
jgi:hypothetical protein